MSSIQKRPTLSQLWAKATRFPMGNRLFSFMVGRQARYTGTIGATVLELGEGRAVVEMRDRPAVRNHLKSVHAIALMNLGELVTGAAVMYQVDGRGRGIVTRLSMDYSKKARGVITGTCEVEVPKAAGQYDFEAKGMLRDAEGDVVATCTATWRLNLEDAPTA